MIPICVTKLGLIRSKLVISRTWIRPAALQTSSNHKFTPCHHQIHTQCYSLLKSLNYKHHNALRHKNHVVLFHTSSPKWNDQKNNKDDDDDDNKEDDATKRKREDYVMMISLFLPAALALSIFTMSFKDNSSSSNDTDKSLQGTVTWNEFLQFMLLAGEVKELVIYPEIDTAYVFLQPNAIYKGQLIKNGTFKLSVSNLAHIEDKIRHEESNLGIKQEHGINIRYATENTIPMISLIIAGAIGLLLMAGLRQMSKGMNSQMSVFNKMTKADFTLIDPKIKSGKGVKFSDVAGLKQAKIEVKEFVDYLKCPEKYKELGARPPKGALLYGPPGCGKTMLAKAVANESNVPFLSMNGSEFVQLIGGVGAARVRSLFSEARKRAPSIIYVDEIDAIGKKRSGGSQGSFEGGSSESEQTLNQLLVEMDGMATVENVIMLASTNRSDVLDKALLRPGRLDRHIEIDLPTLIERKEILEAHMQGVALNDEPSKFSDRLASLTPGFSGADLANVINEAALHAARMKHGKVSKINLEYAIERVIAGPEKKTGNLNPNEKKIVAYHESGHAIVGWMLKHTDALLKVTILPRTNSALGFAQYTPTDRKLYSPEQLMDIMCMALGGRVAESMIFNSITTGASNDLEKVTKIAYGQIRDYGFNEVVGLISFDRSQGGKRPYSKRLQATIDHEARLLIADAYKRTEELLIKHKDDLEKMAQALLQRETLNYQDVEELLGEPPHGKKNLISPLDFENKLTEQAGENQDNK